MPLYLDLLILLNFLVDFLLMIATNRLSGYSNGIKKAALAAVFGGIYYRDLAFWEIRFGDWLACG